MSAWRRQALQLLPEYRETIEEADNPMAMWIDLHLAFDDAMAQKKSELASRVLRYAAWCISTDSGPLPNDISTAVACAFYEHLPEEREYWPHFPKWFGRSQFEQLLPIFGYHLSPGELEELKQFYASKA
jgi:hypothetical protein